MGAHRGLVLAMVLWVGAACGSKSEEEAAKKPVTSAATSAVLEEAGTGTTPKAVDATPAVSSSTVEVVLRGDGLEFTAPGGEVMAVAGPAELPQALGRLEAGGVAPATTTVVITGGDGTYQQLVTVMDALMTRGYQEVRVGRPQQRPDSAETAVAKSELAVLAVTGEDIKVDGKRVGSVAELADEAGAAGWLDGLRSAYAPGTPVAIQADKVTPLATIIRLVEAIGQAGYKDVRFAVERVPATTP